MKSTYWILIGMAAALITNGAFAQDVELDVDARENGMHEPPPPPRAHHVERFMARLSERDPSEFERLETLRLEDPEAFGDELRSILKWERKARRHFDEFPELRDAYQQMPQGKREAFMSAFKGDNNDRPRRKGRYGLNNPEIQSLEEKIRQLTQAYHAEEDPQRQEPIAAEMRSHLLELFDLREGQRAEKILKVEEELDRLRTTLAKRAEKREAIVDRRLEELTSQPTELDW